MEHVDYKTLLVLSLFQLCRAEISQILPGTWFSANAINEDFSPKPISELFSTQSPLQTYSVTQSTPLFSVSHPSSFSPTQSTSFPPKQSQPGFSVTQPIVVLSPSTPSPPPIYASTNSQPPPTTLFQTFSTSKFSESTPLQTYSQDLSSIQYTPSTIATPTYLDVNSFGQPQETPTVRIVPPTPTQFSTTLAPSTPAPAPPNYVLVFQSPPPSSQQPVVTSPTISTTSTPRVVSTSRFTSTSSTSEASTTIAPTIISSTVTSPFTSPTNICRTSPISSTVVTSTLAPSIRPQRPLATISPPLLIRVVAPKGSITNVKINPTTTTKRPRTKRTSKPKRNTYDACIQGCRGRKDILCSIPLSSVLIDSKDLKSFPSICHMACHNSYRSPAYEKLIDGRCSKLRTRILTVGSNSKLRRDELKKTEYSIVNTGEHAVVEFSNAALRA